MGQKWKGFVSRLKGDKNSFDLSSPFGSDNKFNNQVSHGLEDLIHGIVGGRVSQIPRISDKIKAEKQKGRADRIREELRANPALEKSLVRKVLAFPQTYFNERNEAVRGLKGKPRAGMITKGRRGNPTQDWLADEIDALNKESQEYNQAWDHYESLVGDFPNSIHFRSLPRLGQDFREHSDVSDKIGLAPLPIGVFDPEVVSEYGTRDKGLHGSLNIGGVTNETLHDIFLYLPHNLNDAVKVNYTEGEAGMFETFIARMFPGDMTEVAGERNVDMQEIWGAFKQMFPGSNLASKASGNMMNPMKFQALEGIGFRNYSYKFTLRPNNQDEAWVIKQIVQAFKKSRIPGAAGENFRIWTLPNEWSISFQGPIRDWIDHPLACICTGVSVDYGGGSAVTVMEDGSPAAWDLTVEFMETVQLNRQRYETEVAAGKGRKEQASEWGSRIGRGKGRTSADGSGILGKYIGPHGTKKGAID